MPPFSRYIGIDYSGAGLPEQGLEGLAVFMADAAIGGQPLRMLPPGRRRWTRMALADWLERTLSDSGGPALVGIDHGFSMPDAYFSRHGLHSWPAFMEDFVLHWPCHRVGVSVESMRNGNLRHGDSAWLRLTECWTPTAKSVFQFDLQGSVAKSTHAGLPWLQRLRLRGDTHIWPFQGFHIPAGKHLVAEVYPSLFYRRYSIPMNLNSHERDAWAVCRWLRDTHLSGYLERYLSPPLTDDERALALREGWILGVG